MNNATLNDKLSKFFQDGKLVHIHVKKWGMSHQLTKEDLELANQTTEELNTEADQADPEPEKVDIKVAEFMQLGKKFLFIPEVRLKFGRIESQARRFLADNSHPFPITDAHFVPVKKLIPVINRLTQFKEEYDKATQEFLQNYGQYKKDMREKYPDNWASLEPYYPQVESLRQKFLFQVTCYEVAFPKNVKSLTMADIHAQNIAIEQAQEKYRAIMDEQYKHSVRQMEAFVKEAAVGLRGEIVKVFETIANKIRNKEVVSTTNLKTIKETIESFNGLDFLDDSKVKAHLAEVKKLVNSGADFRSDEEALERLNAAVTITLETAKNMTDIDEITGGYIRRLDVGDDL